MVSAPLEDMYPFLDREELEDNMFIPLPRRRKDIRRNLMKRIVVTGATSMIGTALIEECIRHDVEVYAVVRKVFEDKTSAGECTDPSDR